MVYYKISGFSDEISQSVDMQFDVLNKLGIRYFEPRGIDGKNISALTDEEVILLKEKMNKAGIKVSSISSPIGKIKLTEFLHGTMVYIPDIVFEYFPVITQKER